MTTQTTIAAAAVQRSKLDTNNQSQPVTSIATAPLAQSELYTPNSSKFSRENSHQSIGSSLANNHHSGGSATCGGNNAFTVFANTQLQDCYSPQIPGADAQTRYAPSSNAGYNANGDFIGVVPDSAAEPSSRFSSNNLRYWRPAIPHCRICVY